MFMSRRGAAGSGAASGWNKVSAGGCTSSAPSACAALCNAASASVFDLRGARRPDGVTVDAEEGVAGVGRGGAEVEERGEDLAVPGGCGIGSAPWTGISRDEINVVGGLGATGKLVGLSRGVVVSASAVRARRGVPRTDWDGVDLRMGNIARRRATQEYKHKNTCEFKEVSE